MCAVVVLRSALYLFSNSFASAHVLSANDNVPLELVGLLLELCYPDVSLLQHSSQCVNEPLASALRLFNVMHCNSVFSIANLYALLNRQCGRGLPSALPAGFKYISSL
jgi:hypothetical protein